MSLSLDIQITGDDLVARAADSVLARNGSIQKREVQSFGTRYCQEMIAKTPRSPVGSDGERLADAYDVEEDYTADAAFYGFVNEKDYLKWVLEGRGEVEAKPGKMLRIPLPDGVIFRKRVGPASANPFDKGVIDSMQAEGAQLGDTIARQLIAVFGE